MRDCWTLIPSTRMLKAPSATFSKMARTEKTPAFALLRTEEDFRRQAAEIYELYAGRYKRRFRWLSSHHFVTDIGKDLMADAKALRGMLDRFGHWDATHDTKLGALYQLLVGEHPDRKVLIFTQFADTVRYLENQLSTRGLTRIAAVTGGTADPTRMAWRVQPQEQREREPHLARRGTAGSGCHRYTERRAEPTRLRHRRELRPPMGNHPLDPKSRPRGSHRAAGTRHSLLFVPSGRRN